MENKRTFTAFAGERRIAAGDIKSVLLQTKQYLDSEEIERLLIFEDQSGRQIDFDFRGTPEQVIERLASHPLFESDDVSGQQRSGPGRPRLGVVSREVSLLPRHWEWLEQQPSGISAALRKLVEQARKLGAGDEQARRDRDAAGKFMWAMAGNLENFEEVSRALYADDQQRLQEMIGNWPPDIREHVLHLLKLC